MPNILIRNVPEEDLARVDESARAQGLSREEFLRRKIAQVNPPAKRTMTDADWDRLADLTKDLRDEELMRQAWS